jgi:transcriptional regulator with XRE-family HTH domain
MKKPPSFDPKTRHLSVIPGGKPEELAPLTRAQVAARLGVSVSTVRRFEGERLHPQIGPEDVRWFDAVEVAALAAELADEPRARRLRNAGREPGAKPAPRSADEVAAEVFERLEQRQSLAEIVVGVRIAPERVRELHEQWCRGLIEGQLRSARTPQVPLDRDHVRIPLAELATRLAELPEGMTRISVARYRGAFNAPTPEGDDAEFAWVSELGGFHVSGPCDVSEIVRRFGKGDYRITAYGLNPPGLRWEVIVKGVGAVT